MAKTPKNHNQPWRRQDDALLRKENTPTRVVGLKLGRTPGAVQGHANDVGLSTRPTNQSP